MLSIGEHAETLYARAAQLAYARELDLGRPSMMLRPKVFMDVDQWCALYGDNLQDGVAGFGSSPERAYYDFDRNWLWSTAEKDACDAEKAGIVKK
jgi:hypothetical protein